jgi:hypothetical protein
MLDFWEPEPALEFGPLMQVPAVCLPPCRGLALLCRLALITGMMLDETR